MQSLDAIVGDEVRRLREMQGASMIIGFTGTRHGMSERQRAEFEKLIIKYRPTEFRHGDCIGADDQAATMVYRLAAEINFTCEIVGHAPVDEAHRAFNKYTYVWRAPKRHFARNRDIVAESEILIAAPITDVPQMFGGTWYTIGQGKKKGMKIHILSR